MATQDLLTGTLMRDAKSQSVADATSERRRHVLVAWLEELARSADGRAERPPWPHASLHSFVLTEGKSYVSTRLSAEERRVVRAAASKYRLHNGPFRARHCFANAQGALLLDRSRRLVYTEGFVLDERSSLPFLHGWLTINGKVVEFTDVRMEDAPPEPPAPGGALPHRRYFGVEFCRGYVENWIAVTGGRGSLIDAWEHEFPLLSSKARSWCPT